MDGNASKRSFCRQHHQTAIEGLSATGAPFLANDPHLGFQSPNLWYLAGLSYPGVTLTGATSPGVPYHLFGHNGSLAWGVTTTHGDTQDLFVETPTADNASYQTPDGPAPFVTHQETITVRFGKPLALLSAPRATGQ